MLRSEKPGELDAPPASRTELEILREENKLLRERMRLLEKIVEIIAGELPPIRN